MEPLPFLVITDVDPPYEEKEEDKKKEMEEKEREEKEREEKEKEENKKNSAKLSSRDSNTSLVLLSSSKNEEQKIWQTTLLLDGTPKVFTFTCGEKVRDKILTKVCSIYASQFETVTASTPICIDKT
jgi:hypothetical protein